MTEDEAKTKWCPFARVATVGPNAEGKDVSVAVAFNRIALPDEGRTELSVATCAASACMAWRWGPTPPDHRAKSLYDKATGKRVPAGFDHATEWRLDNPDEPAPLPVGFCGLAGRQP